MQSCSRDLGTLPSPERPWSESPTAVRLTPRPVVDLATVEQRDAAGVPRGRASRLHRAHSPVSRAPQGKLKASMADREEQKLRKITKRNKIEAKPDPLRPVSSARPSHRSGSPVRAPPSSRSGRVGLSVPASAVHG